MNYLYYSLKKFYNLWPWEKSYPDIGNITAILGLLPQLFILSLFDGYFHLQGKLIPSDIYYIFIAAAFGLWKLLYDYYLPREASLLKRMDAKPKWIRLIIIASSFIFIVIVIKMFMFDGGQELFEYFVR